MTATDYQAMTRALTTAFAPLAASFRTISVAFQRLGRTMHITTQYADRKHRARCRVCNPTGNPRPLRIDGAAYHRRTRARRGPRR